MFCSKCGNKIEKGTKFCSKCGQEVGKNSRVLEVKDEKNTDNRLVDFDKNQGEANVFLVIASFIIPLLGLVLYITDKDKNVKNAKACGIAAIVGFVINIIFTVISTIFSIFFALV